MVSGPSEMDMDNAGVTTQVNWDMPSQVDQQDEHSNRWFMNDEGHHPNFLTDQAGFSSTSGFDLFTNANQAGFEDNYGMIVNNGVGTTSALLAFPNDVPQYHTLTN